MALPKRAFGSTGIPKFNFEITLILKKISFTALSKFRLTESGNLGSSMPENVEEMNNSQKSVPNMDRYVPLTKEFNFECIDNSAGFFKIYCMYKK